MARYNTKTKRAVTRTKDEGTVLNHEGAPAYDSSVKEKLVGILFTSFMDKKGKYYESNSDLEDRLRELIAQEPEFAAKCAIWARNRVGMRSVTQFTAAEIGHIVKGESWTQRFFTQVIDRPDDMVEAIAAYLSIYGKPLPNAMKKGFAKAFDKFDAYQIGKYRREGHAVSLVDVVNLVHPRPVPKNAEALKALVAGTLRSEGTWETKLSAAGQSNSEEEKNEAKEQAWAELVGERKIGYLALLRNLRNIETQAPDVLDDALKMLVDPKLIEKNRVFPFQFLSAYNSVSSQKTRTALDKAINLSFSNVPEFSGRTLVAVDHSGSMGYSGSINSPRFTADLFAAAVLKKNPEADVIVFGTTAKLAKLDAGDTLLSIVNQLSKIDCGGGTNLQAIFGVAKRAYDRIFIMSDMQTYLYIDGTARQASAYGYYGLSNADQAFQPWKAKYDCDPYVYCFDLAGYGSQQFNSGSTAGKTCQLFGFSEKVFTFVKNFEVDPKEIVEEIERTVTL